MYDLISRQEAINALKGKLNISVKDTKYIIEYLNGILERILQLPSAKPQWILVNEKLPDSQTKVIVSCTDDSGDTKFRYTSSGWITTDKEYWIVDNEINNFITAWMSLPEPYKEGKQE